MELRTEIACPANIYVYVPLCPTVVHICSINALPFLLEAFSVWFFSLDAGQRERKGIFAFLWNRHDSRSYYIHAMPCHAMHDLNTRKLNKFNDILFSIFHSFVVIIIVGEGEGWPTENETWLGTLMSYMFNK